MATVTTEKRPDRATGKLREVHITRWRDPSGKQCERTFTRKGDANDWAIKVENDKRTGAYTDPSAGRITFGNYAAGWLATKRATRKASTVSSYEEKLRSHILPMLGNRPMAGIQRSDVQALVNAKAATLAPSTLRAVYSVVASVFKEAVRDRLIPRSPCDRIALPAKVATKVVPLTPEQVFALADAINPRYRALVLTGAGTGLRRSELFGLTVDRVDFLRRVVTVDRQLADDQVTPDGLPEFTTPKTSASNRKVPLPQVVANVLAAHLAEYGPGPGGLVFSNTGRGARGTASSAGRVIRHSGFYEA